MDELINVKSIPINIDKWIENNKLKDNEIYIKINNDYYTNYYLFTRLSYNNKNIFKCLEKEINDKYRVLLMNNIKS